METTTTDIAQRAGIGSIIAGCFSTTTTALFEPTVPEPTSARRRAAYAPLGLTPSEHDVVALVAQGASNREIAHELGISRRTVESHLEHVFVKLDIKSRLRLAVLYLSAGGAGDGTAPGTDRE